MPACHWHPKVETNVACPDCERFMCPKDMVETPVGYKCRECARPAKGQTAYVKPRQSVLAALAALVTAAILGFVLAFAGSHFFLVPLLYGVAVAEAARRGSGGHRGPVIAMIAGAASALGSLIAFGFDPLSICLAIAAAVVYASRNVL